MDYFENAKATYIVDVLGTPYSVYMNVSENDDPNMAKCDGYCDKTTKRIVVAGMLDDCELADFKVYEKTNLRHELIHAFLFESGLDGNSYWGNGENDHPEQMIEWMALQFPKMVKAFEYVDAL